MIKSRGGRGAPSKPSRKQHTCLRRKRGLRNLNTASRKRQIRSTYGLRKTSRTHPSFSLSLSLLFPCRSSVVGSRRVEQLATKRLWAEGQKLSRQRDRDVELGKSARVVQRAFKVTKGKGGASSRLGWVGRACSGVAGP